MMQNLLNVARREAERVMSRLALPKTGIVSGYDPANYSAKVTLQPQGVETGWLPVRTPWAGNGWGLFCPPDIGDEVEVQFQEGGKQAGYVALRAFGDRFRPLEVPSGEFWLVHKSGSSLKFLNDGTVELHAQTALNSSAPLWTHTGDLVVNGSIRASEDIWDFYLVNTYTMAGFRVIYDIHTHPVSAGTTLQPNQQV
jgi:phage baseplate assembly protein gpV